MLNTKTELSKLTAELDKRLSVIENELTTAVIQLAKEEREFSKKIHNPDNPNWDDDIKQARKVFQDELDIYNSAYNEIYKSLVYSYGNILQYASPEIFGYWTEGMISNDECVNNIIREGKWHEV